MRCRFDIRRGDAMNAKFMPYEYVPTGFEMVIQDKEVKAWSLWWNLRLTDDPEAWDDDVMRLNKLQRSLGELAASQRLIRAHMAQFCRHHPTFPKNVDILCKEIGDDELSTPVTLGCEDRGLLDALGYGDPQSPQEKRDEIFGAYGEALRKWLRHQPPETPADDKVFGILGRATDVKVAFAEELHTAIANDDPSMLSLKKLAGKAGEETDGESRLAGCLLKTISRNQRGDHETEEVAVELIDSFPEATSWLRDSHSVSL